MIAPELQTLAQAFAERMLNTAPEGMILAASVWALLRLMNRQNSGIRFAIWFLVLLAVVALPFFAGYGLGGYGLGAAHSPAVHLPIIASVNLHREIILSSSWASYLLAAWALGAAVSLLRLSVGLWRVHCFRSHCSELDLASLAPEIAAILRQFASTRRVELCVSSDVASPAAIGFFRPAIVFPAWLLPQLSASEIEVILLHENAHLQRWDQWTNLAQKFVKAVLFFHPAVWWIDNRLTLEREMACDDRVVAQSKSPRTYATFLISFAEKLQNERAMTLVQALLSRTRQMSQRVARILDAKQPHRTGLWKPVLVVNVVSAASAGLLALAFGVAPYVPHFVAFQSQPSHSQLTLTQAKTRAATQATKQATKNAPQSAVIASEELHPAVASLPTRRLPLSSQPIAIPAAFNQRTVVLPMRPKATQPTRPVVIHAKAVRKELPRQATFVVLQTTQYDSSGSAVWTLSIWKVDGANSAETQLESAILLTI